MSDIYGDKKIHNITITPTDQDGIYTGRMRYRVECLTCKVLVHEATTGPLSRLKTHWEGESGHEEPLPKPEAVNPIKESKDIDEMNQKFRDFEYRLAGKGHGVPLQIQLESGHTLEFRKAGTPARWQLMISVGKILNPLTHCSLKVRLIAASQLKRLLDEIPRAVRKRDDSVQEAKDQLTHAMNILNQL